MFVGDGFDVATVVVVARIVAWFVGGMCFICISRFIRGGWDAKRNWVSGIPFWGVRSWRQENSLVCPEGCMTFGC